VTLASKEEVDAVDPEFGRMAAEVGEHAWSIRQLSMREKTFAFLAADLCSGCLGFPLAAHVTMAGMNGVSVPECRAAIRHLAPYVGYPVAAMALRQLRDLQQPHQTGPVRGTSGQPGHGGGAPTIGLPPATRQALEDMDADFAAFFARQFDQRWSADGSLSPRERALSCLAADVVQQAPEESFSLDLDLAVAAGAAPGDIRAVFLLAAEYGLGKAWRAYRLLKDRGGSIRPQPDRAAPETGRRSR
jgi:alkylhydroperoxidase/carboxymuconolactone decarboxylase family protein YurZ